MADNYQYPAQTASVAAVAQTVELSRHLGPATVGDIAVVKVALARLEDRVDAAHAKANVAKNQAASTFEYVIHQEDQAARFVLAHKLQAGVSFILAVIAVCLVLHFL